MTINFGDPTIYTRSNYVQPKILPDWITKKRIVWFRIDMHWRYWGVVWMVMDERGYLTAPIGSLSLFHI